jgi:hypothetical protein
LSNFLFDNYQISLAAVSLMSYDFNMQHVFAVVFADVVAVGVSVTVP